MPAVFAFLTPSEPKALSQASLRQCLGTCAFNRAKNAGELFEFYEKCSPEWCELSKLRNRVKLILTTGWDNDFDAEVTLIAVKAVIKKS